MRVEILNSLPINPGMVFDTVDEASTAGALGQQITRGSMYYEASKSRPGLLDQVMPDGRRYTGHFSNGVFVPE